MTEVMLHAQALTIVNLWPRINRLLFTLDINDPTIELPVAQMRVCSILRDGPRTMSSISLELGISVSAVTQITDRLVRAGMAERVMEDEDRRVRLLQLTPRAEEIMNTRRARRAARVQQALTHIPPPERATIIEVLNQLLEAGQAMLPASSEEHVDVELIEG